jgi:hypothetical protein
MAKVSKPGWMNLMKRVCDRSRRVNSPINARAIRGLWKTGRPLSGFQHECNIRIINTISVTECAVERKVARIRVRVAL